MQLLAVQRILGLLLVLFSSAMWPPIAVSLYYDDGAAQAFLLAFGITLTAGTLLWLPARRARHDLRLRDGFLITVLFWTVLGLFGALPLYWAQEPMMGVVDAIFESMSGLTTTGATVITALDDLPRSILFYRQQLQWLGGMGIIVLAVAILPMLGVGGMQLYRAETPGPMKDNKLTPRITETAKALWYIYLGLTVACAVAYWWAGMTPFNAVAHSFSTVAIGGFSPHDASMGYYDHLPMVQVIAIVFMLLGGTNFALHYVAWSRRTLNPYARDSEFRTYILVLAAVAVIAAGYLYFNGVFAEGESAVLHGVFQAVSIGTTTGFTTAEWYLWPTFLPVLLLFVSFIGGSAFSTGGGMKVIRFLLLFKQGTREINRLVHPNAVITIKLGGRPVPDRVIDSVWGFFSIYVAAFAVMLVLLMASGLDQITAFSAVAATLNNLGPGLGEVGPHFANINDFAKLVLTFAMLLGRLEIFTVLVLFTAAFWRK